MSALNSAVQEAEVQLEASQRRQQAAENRLEAIQQELEITERQLAIDERQVEAHRLMLEAARAQLRAEELRASTNAPAPPAGGYPYYATPGRIVALANSPEGAQAIVERIFRDVGANSLEVTVQPRAKSGLPVGDKVTVRVQRSPENGH
ncbi:uncharacterized protein FIESC28_07402 [Fusarium coffeatum]|uniref:Uncharacterized protein n=1 Tax=Fusarium coffeatum TaxID=231269 RepID=A0A366REI4_9HYPO|nr:uncharacterized protein FIESC28_07402 [Fusarium coffeatum]RBR15222.1 hypothetical protein FIESC28_07402 [Fusarium coffeatum]